MGCWNGTCLISNLPIYAGDKVVFFVLKRKRYAKLDAVEGGHHYVDDLYEPLLYPIVGEYDDYGCIENVSEDFSLIEKYFESVELTENDWDKDNDVFRNIERGNYKGYGHALIHKDIYDALIEKTYDRGEWWTKGKSLRDHVVENIEKKTEEYFRHKQIWDKDNGGIPFNLVGGTYDLVCGRDSRDFFIARYLKTQDETLRNKLIETHLINVVLSQCRKFWFTQTGSGSQSSEVELYEILANKMIEKCQRWSEENGY
jgi:hypothetical protein